MQKKTKEIELDGWCDKCKNYRSGLCYKCTRNTLRRVGKIKQPTEFEESLSYNNCWYRR